MATEAFDGRFRGPFPGQQTKFFERNEREVFYGGAAGGGKLLALDTMIPTPTGWVRNDEILIGDEVMSTSGRPVRVVGLSDVVENEDAYRLSFSDGTSIVAGERHLWLTTTAREREAIARLSEGFRAARRYKRLSRATGKNIRPHVAPANSSRRHEYKDAPVASVRTTLEIVETLETSRGARNHAIEQHHSLILPQATVPVPAYTLGAWLGDGNSNGGGFTGVDDEIVDWIRVDGFEVRRMAAQSHWHIQGLIGKLRTAGVLNNKHIPAAYLRASWNQRCEVLRGLMDTDGWCEKDGSCKIALTRKELFDGVVELIRTMGIVVHVSHGKKSASNGRPGNSTDCWTACFVTPLPVFRLSRKHQRQNLAPDARYLRRFIVAAENLGPLPMRCIQVANPDGMYLAGEQFIPTHNSLCGMAKFGQQLAVENARYERGDITNSKAWGLYIRKTMPDLRQAIQKSYELFRDIDPDATYNVNDHLWTFPSCGNAHFEFGHMETEAARFKYKSREFSYVFVDELTEHSEVVYEYLDTRIRTTDDVLGGMLQICSGSNPDGPGLLWVRKRFIEKKKPEVTYRKRFTLRDGRVRYYDSIFIPAKLDDNPVLMAQGNYEASLLNKRPEVREAILHGNWYVNAGAFLADIWDTGAHVCPNHDVPKSAHVFRMCDPGLTAPSSVIWAYVDKEQCMTAFHALNVRNHDAAMLAGRIREIEIFYGFWDEDANESTLNGPIDEDAFSRNLAGGPSYAKVMRECGIRWVRSKKDRFNGTAEVVRRLNARVKSLTPGIPDRPMLRFMERCASPIETLPMLQSDPNDPNDVDTKGNDHDWDSVRYGCMYRRLFGDKEKAEDDDDLDNITDIGEYRGRGTSGLGSPPGGW